MRFARLRDPQGRDIHLWIDDGFNKETADYMVKMLKMQLDVEKKMGKDAIKYEFSDSEYVGMSIDEWRDLLSIILPSTPYAEEHPKEQPVRRIELARKLAAQVGLKPW